MQPYQIEEKRNGENFKDTLAQRVRDGFRSHSEMDYNRFQMAQPTSVLYMKYEVVRYQNECKVRDGPEMWTGGNMLMS